MNGAGYSERQRPRGPREDHPHHHSGPRHRGVPPGREFSLLIRFPADKGAMAPAIAPFPKETTTGKIKNERIKNNF